MASLPINGNFISNKGELELRDDFSFKTKEELAKRVAYRCSNPQCRQPTIGPKGNSDGTISIGEAAHICAASSGGKRYDPTMSSEERSACQNGIWLCRNCAAMIDRDEAYYTVELLNAWKQLAEMEASKNVTGNRMHTELIVLSDADKSIVDRIIRTMECENTSYMLKEHDYHCDFQRNWLDPLFNLMVYLQQPSAIVCNIKLRESVQNLLESIEDLRASVALKGGPAKYGNGSYIIDFPEDQADTNNLCNEIWDKYILLVKTYRMLS